MSPLFATDSAGEVAFRASRIDSITLVKSEEDHREALVQIEGEEYPHKVTEKQAKELIASLRGHEHDEIPEEWMKVLYMAKTLERKANSLTLSGDLEPPASRIPSSR